jgi:hypothetical protein
VADQGLVTSDFVDFVVPLFHQDGWDDDQGSGYKIGYEKANHGDGLSEPHFVRQKPALGAIYAPLGFNAPLHSIMLVLFEI